MCFSASGTCVWPSACFLVQPAPVTNNSCASGRMVWASAFGSRMPSTVVRLRASGRATGTFSTLAVPAPHSQAVWLPDQSR